MFTLQTVIIQGLANSLTLYVCETYLVPCGMLDSGSLIESNIALHSQEALFIGATFSEPPEYILELYKHMVLLVSCKT